MRPTLLASAASIAALLAPLAYGQAQYDPNTGTAIPGVGDDSSHVVTLGFNMTFPDGSSGNQCEVDSNGRITAVGGGSDYSESVSELLNDTNWAIAPNWDDLSPQNGGGILFNTTSSVAVFTWPNVVSYNGSIPYTFQCQLHSDGRIVFVYDARMIAGEEPIIGLSPGNGAADPLSSDLTAGGSTAGVSVLYEDFAANLDVQDLAIEFIPDGVGGWIYQSGPAGFPPLASASVVGDSCPSSFRLTPDGVGGYIVTRELGNWFDDSVIGTELANVPGSPLGDDALTAPQPLGWSFTMPGGTVVTDLVMDNNGRILADNSPGGGDFSPTVADFLGTAGYPAAIAVCWSDLSAQLGSLRMFTDNAGFASVTWEGVPQYAEANAFTAQALLYGDGSIQLNFLNVREWRTGSGFSSDNFLVGCSSGNLAADPGSTDLSALNAPVATGDVFYEFFDASLGEQPDLQPELEIVSAPILGGNFEVRMRGVSANTVSANLFLGFFPLNVDLTGLFGMDHCSLLVNPAVPAIPLVVAGEEATYSLAMPLNPGFAGVLNLHVQGINAAPGSTAFGLLTTNAVYGTAGF